MATLSKSKRAAQALAERKAIALAQSQMKSKWDDHDDDDETPVDRNFFISEMALYDLDRVESALKVIEDKLEWTLSDTSSVDCMHYDGDAALDHCAFMLGLDEKDEKGKIPFRRILDIGSGFSSTGRYLASKYRADVTGVELQRRHHELAELITARNEDAWVREHVRSVNADVLKVEARELHQLPEDIEFEGFDHIVCLLCVMHFSKADRINLFKRAYELLKPAGSMYIEDFYHRKPMTKDERTKLREIVSCSYLPNAIDYVEGAEDAEFDDALWEDVTMFWAPIVKQRAEEYRMKKDKKKELEVFYDTVADLFEAGNVGGVRLTIRKPHPNEGKTAEEIQFEEKFGVTLKGRPTR
ncbi:hypothetical protein N7G274_010132 [Stereocaulon virgatum]|uniref:phosphoethanolamine N-methyltransferase n=1 Tax=Stereocaulon virgatum TaxID=373712 RepID=A0ABR3ZW43_9LECA